MAQKFRFGKNAVILAAAITSSMVSASGQITKPGPNAFTQFCLPREVTIGSEAGTTDIESFCTQGQTISVRDGSTKGTLNLGEVLWVEDDPVLQMLDAAYEAEDEVETQVFMSVLPLGAGVGKPVFDFVVQVNKWELKIPSKGLITATYDFAVLEGPNRGIQGSEGAINNTILTSGTPVNYMQGAQGSVQQFSITAAEGQALGVTLAGGTGNADLKVLAPNGTQAGVSSNPDNTEAVNIPATVAGTYTIQVLGTAAYNGTALTATLTGP